MPEKNVTLVRGSGQATPDTQFLMRAHRRLLSMAQAQRTPLVLNDTASAGNPEALPHRVLCCSLRSRAGRCIGVLALSARRGRRAFTERDARIAEILARKAIGVIESQLRCAVRPVHAPGLRAARARRRRRPQGRTPWSALYIDVDQLHVINEKFGMHVGDAVLGAARRADPPAPAARGLRRAHLRRPLRGAAAGAGATTRRPSPSRCARAPSGSAVMQGEARLPVPISVGVALLDRPREELAHVARRRPRPPARPPRIAAATASRSTSRTTPASCAASPTSTSPRALREAIDRGRLRLDAQLILPFATAETARPHYELLLRMIDEDGRTVGPDTLPVGRGPLPAHAGDRPLGVNHVIESLQPRAAILEGRRARLRHQFLRPVAQRRGVPRFPDRAHRSAAASIRSCSASSSPRTPPWRASAARRGAHAPAAPAGLRRGAR